MLLEFAAGAKEEAVLETAVELLELLPSDRALIERIQEGVEIEVLLNANLPAPRLCYNAQVDGGELRPFEYNNCRCSTPAYFLHATPVPPWPMRTQLVGISGSIVEFTLL